MIKNQHDQKSREKLLVALSKGGSLCQNHLG
jgi:hypothetical protein